MHPYPQDQWYVVAWSRDVGRGLSARTVCGEPVVLFRATDGRVVALGDRCAHRRYPLSLGSLVGDVVQCGYHGLTYDCSGTCVSVPGQSRVPSAARVRSYPVLESSGWVWLFVGDPENADARDVPDTHWLDDPGWAAIGDVARIACRYSLLVDNLLDLSHETYLHAGYIGTPEVASTPITTEVDEPGGVVRVSRRMRGAQIPEFYARSTGLSTPIDRWQDIEYRPLGFYRLDSRVAPAGQEPLPGGSDDGAAHMKILYAITPETEGSTLDFWAVARDFALGDEEVTGFLDAMQRTIVQQDVDALEVLELVVAAEERGPGVRELSVRIDSGALAARRMIEKQRAGS
ncbi:MAG: aromatic ring-hydroxylating dioxygenase subunit alpha [Actinomycetota bacterium]|nr:aromatic ring-hydroxylating dioxygenase subunit alpha [Actinomycetota bacterium]